MAATSDLILRLRSEDQTKGVLKEFRQNFLSLKTLAIGAGVAGATAIVGLGIASIKMAADFETAFAEVTTLFEGSQEQVKAIKDDVLDLSASLGVDAVEAAKSAYQAISAGVEPARVITFLAEATTLAVGGVTDLATATDLSTTAMNAWGLASSELQAVNDALFTTVRLGKTTIDELGASLFNVAPVAAQAGVGLDTVGAALAVLTSRGVPTAQATVQLAAAIQALNAPTREQIARAKELGFEFEEGAIRTKGLAAVLGDLMETTGGSATLLRQLVGSTEAVKAIFTLAGEGAADFAAAEGEMANKAGAADAAFEKMNDTLERRLQIAIAQIRAIMIELGGEVLPVLADAVAFAANALRGFTQDAEGAGLAAVEAKIRLLELVEAFLESMRIIGLVAGAIVAIFNPAMGVALVAAAVAANFALKGVRDELDDTRQELGRLSTANAVSELRALADEARGTTREVTLLLQANEALAAQSAAFRPVSPLIQELESLDAQIARLAEGGQLSVRLDQLIARRAEIIDQIRAFGAAVAAGTEDVGGGPTGGGVGGALAEAIADDFREALTAADLPAVAADELVGILAFLDSIRVPPSLQDQLDFIRAMVDQADTLADVADEGDAAADALNRIRSALREAADFFGLTFEQVENLAQEMGLIPSDAEELQAALRGIGDDLTQEQIQALAEGLVALRNELTETDDEAEDLLDTLRDSVDVIAEFADVSANELLDALVDLGEETGALATTTEEDFKLTILAIADALQISVQDVLAAIQEIKDETDELFDAIDERARAFQRLFQATLRLGPEFALDLLRRVREGDLPPGFPNPLAPAPADLGATGGVTIYNPTIILQGQNAKESLESIGLAEVAA